MCSHKIVAAWIKQVVVLDSKHPAWRATSEMDYGLLAPSPKIQG